ncbi:MAG: hypothetical protein KGM44_13475 [bacterium]|nr:hypothetical protein [bacterium]
MPPPDPAPLLLVLLAWRGDAAIALIILAAISLAAGGLWLARSEERPLGTPAQPWWADAGAREAGDAASRLALVEGLGARGGSRDCAILARAWVAESDPSVREGVLAALQWCEGEVPLEIFHEALDAPSEAERILAIEGFERRAQHAAIEPALADPSDVVALAAAYALRRAGACDGVTQACARRGPAFAAMLALLERG